jgi:hypothetical protein
MANRYWAAGVFGNWNSTASWSSTADGLTVPASVPVSGDAVFFNAASGFVTATLDISPTVASINCSGFNGTLDFLSRVIFLDGTGTVFTGSTTMSVFSSGNPLITLTNSSATGRTISPQIVTEQNSISFSVSAGTGTLTLTSNQSFRDVSLTGFTGSLASSSPVIYGSLTLDPGMTVTSAGTMTFAATSGINTIATSGVTFDRNITFNGVGGTWRLIGALTSGTRTTTLTAGTLNLNGNTFSMGVFSSTNANIRLLDFGTGGGIYLTSIGTVTIYTASDSTNFSVSGDRNVFVTGAGTGGNIRSITPGLLTSGGSAANALNFNISAGSDTINFGTANRVFNNIQFSGTFSGNIGANVAPQIYGFFSNNGFATITGGTNAWVFRSTSSTNYISSSQINNPVTFDGIGGKWQIYNNLVINGAVTLTNGTLQIQSGNTLTVNSFTTSGATQKYLESTTPDVQASISDASGVNSVNYLTIKDSAATGGATWNAFYDQGNINAGNNSGWYFGDSPTVGNEITMRLRSFTQPRRF